MNFLDSFSLAGKKALVICPEHMYGPELVQGLIAGGAKVWVAGAKETNLPGVEGFFPYNHADAVEADKLVDDAVAQMGSIDVMVENVLNMDTAHGWSHDFATINTQCQTAMRGMMNTVMSVGRQMAAQGHGSVILATDYGALVGYDAQSYVDCPDFAGNDFSLIRGFIKGSCVNYARQASNYLAEHGCRCNCLALSPMAGKQPEAFEQAFVRHSQIKRLITAEDIAGALVFLASDASGFITGHTLPVDGGYTAK